MVVGGGALVASGGALVAGGELQQSLLRERKREREVFERREKVFWPNGVRGDRIYSNMIKY